MGLKMKNVNVMVGHWKIWFLKGGREKSIYKGELPKKGAWAICRFKGGRGGWVGVLEEEEGGVDTLMYAMS